MLRYFRINDPYRLLGLFVLLGMLCLPLFIDSAGTTLPELKTFLVGEKVAEGHALYSEIIDTTPPFASWFYGICDWIFGRNLTGRHLVTFVILFLQSAFLGIILIDKKAFPENTYIPSLLFSLLTLVSFDVLSLTADIASFGFLLLTLNTMLTEIEFRVQRDETIFNLGLFVSLASLFNFSYVIYLPGIFIILLIFTRNNVRKYLLMVVGFLLPHMVLFCLFYLYGHGEELWGRFYLPNLTFSSHSLMSIKSLLFLCAAPLFYLFVSLFILNRDAHLTKYQSQMLQAMFVWFLIALVQLYFTPDLRPQSLLPLAPPVCFFFTHFLLLIRRRKFAEINTWVLLLGIAGVMYLARYKKAVPIDYSRLLANSPSVLFTGKRILVLDNDPGIYLSNTLSPSFIDPNLTKEIFDGPQYYENVLLVNRLFNQDAPEIILDPDNRMDKFFDRLPGLKGRYTKSENGYWVLINN